MKKIIQKLGVIGLIIAVLIPFIELPKVNAKTTSCTTHLQNYLFLDINWLMLNDDDETFLDIYGEGYQTFTNFPYAFPDSKTNEITIKSVGINDLTDDNYNKELSKFWALYENNELIDKSGSEDYLTEIAGRLLVKSAKLSSYNDNTVLFHGVWSNYDADGKPIKEQDDVAEYVSTNQQLEQTLQYALKDNRADIKTTIGTAEFDGDSKFTLKDKDEISTSGVDFFNKIANDPTSEYVWENEGTKYFSLAINRKLDYGSKTTEEYFNDKLFGYVYTDGKVYIFTDDDSTTAEPRSTVTQANLDDPDTGIKDSYSGYLKYAKDESTNSTAGKYIKQCTDCKIEDGRSVDLDFTTSKGYYWPTVLNVEYESCPKEASTTEKWTLAYDSNVTDNSVTNMPSKLADIAIGTDATVDSKAPSRTDYTFNNWCETKEGTGKCYKTGEKVTSPTSSKTITLYAQWVKGGKEDPVKTGVMSYVIGFITVGAIAGAIYLVSKKKNFFKQI